MADCKFCGKKISWLKQGRGFRAFEEDGMPHECEERQKTLDTSKNLSVDDVKNEEIQKYLLEMKKRREKKK